ncbi:MAG: hypothetical protein RBU37_17050 [Myxococcota bacterium]|jgi:hypothetical protein|nr:hypothetical protein [Myxococcota bacterium]
MKELQNAEQASYWLGGRLKKMEASTLQSAELGRLLSDGARDVLIDIDADPVLFSRDAADRVRRYSSRCREATLDELRRKGFQLEALDRSQLELLGLDAGRCMELLDAMIGTLRQRVEALGVEGAQAYEQANTNFQGGLREVLDAVVKAREHWLKKGAGRHRSSLLPWRRWAAAKLDPINDNEFRLDVAAAAQRVSPAMLEALEGIGRGSILLTISKYYSDIMDHLSELLADSRALGERARRASAEAERRLGELRRTMHKERRDVDMLLIDDATLDNVLASLGVDTLGFLQRSHSSFRDLAGLNAEDFEGAVREWLDTELTQMSLPQLSEALGGIGSDSTALSRRVTEIVVRAQPLMSFNDDLAVRYEEGQRAQCYAIAECDDQSVVRAIDEACDLLGFPNPLLEPSRQPQQAESRLRLMLFAAGLPFFAQYDRLKRMLATHAQTIERRFHESINVQILEGLRDMSRDIALPELLPDTLQAALFPAPSGAYAKVVLESRPASLAAPGLEGEAVTVSDAEVEKPKRFPRRARKRPPSRD